MVLMINHHEKKSMENASFVLDTLKIPDDSSNYNEYDTRQFIRLIGIKHHLKMDKYHNVEKISYKKPKPELGETVCERVKCPSWFSKVICWKCK